MLYAPCEHFIGDLYVYSKWDFHVDDENCKCHIMVNTTWSMKHGKGALICWYTDKFWPNSVRSVKLIILGCCTV